MYRVRRSPKRSLCHPWSTISLGHCVQKIFSEIGSG